MTTKTWPIEAAPELEEAPEELEPDDELEEEPDDEDPDEPVPEDEPEDELPEDEPDDEAAPDEELEDELEDEPAPDEELLLEELLLDELPESAGAGLPLLPPHAESSVITPTARIGESFNLRIIGFESANFLKNVQSTGMSGPTVLPPPAPPG